MRIAAQDAVAYFRHPSQRILGLDLDKLPEEFEYWANGSICGVFHGMPWPGVVMAHYGVKPEGWGKLVQPAREILEAFWQEHSPARIVGWTQAANRPAMAFARRLGFEEDGRFDADGETIIMQGWRPKWA